MMEIGRLLWIVIILVGGVGIFIGLSWALKQREQGKPSASYTRDDGEPMLEKIQFDDYINNALGFSAVFLAIFVFYVDFFDVIVRIFPS